MVAQVLLPRLIRRLAAVILTFGVLFSSVGWAEPACDSHGVSASVPAQQAHVGHGTPASGDAPAPDGDHDCPHQGPDGMPPGTGCAMTAHCAASVAPVPEAAEPMIGVVASDAPAAAALAEPPLAAYQPASPPPKR